MSALAQWLPSILAPFGWYIVHALAKKRDSQSELRKFSSEIITFINELEKESITYHTNSLRSKQLEEDILSNLDKLELMSGRLVKMGAKTEIPILHLRATITLKNFQTKDFTSQAIDSYLIRDVRLSTRLIIENLYNIV